MAKVSVIIPVYNTEAYLKRCLDSIHNQTFKDLEIIAVNDGSTDNSLKILEHYKYENNDKLKILDQENQGAAVARKNAIKNSSSDYIAFVDSDDYIDKDYIQNLITNIETNKTNIVCSRIGVHLEHPLLKNIVLRDRKRKKGIIDLREEKDYLPIISVTTPAKLFKREFVNITDKNFKANEDLSINYCNYVQAQKISFDEATTYHYLPTKSGSVSRNISGYNYNNMYNTFGPLEELRTNFMKIGMLDYYYKEIESLYIKNLFQRIAYIEDNVNDVIQKEKLINLIINFISVDFPNWENNIYLNNNFKHFEIPDMINSIKVKNILKKYNINQFCDSKEEVLQLYKKASVR